MPSISSTFRRLEAPAIKRTLRFGSPSLCATNVSRASFAAWSMGGAATRILRSGPCRPATSVRLARGWMYTATRTLDEVRRAESVCTAIVSTGRCPAEVRDGSQDARENPFRGRRAAGHGHVHGNHVRHSAAAGPVGPEAGSAFPEDASSAAAVADGDDELRIRGRIVDAPQRRLH